MYKHLYKSCYSTYYYTTSAIFLGMWQYCSVSGLMFSVKDNIEGIPYSPASMAAGVVELLSAFEARNTGPSPGLLTTKP